MMKVLLIYPPSFDMITTNVPDIIDEETGKYPPLGVMYIAAGIERFTRWEVDILDTQIGPMDYHQLEEEIRKRQPDVVGIEALTFSLVDVYHTASVVKKVSQDILVVLGGPHVFLFPEESIASCHVDALCLGEAEYSFPEFLKCIEQNHPFDTVPGIVYKRQGQILYTGAPHLLDNLDQLPFPARHLVPYKKYYSVLAKGQFLTTMMTSRGCPARCIFCDRPHLGKTFRARSASNVVDEIEECVKRFDIREFFFYDDTFSINRERVLAICQEILGRKLDILWDIRARVNTMDTEVLSALKRAGCARIHYGIEAGTPEILNVLKKGITLEKVKEVFRLTKKVRIQSLGYFMIGNPTETKEQIEETLRFSQSIDADYIHLSLTTPFPGTELYQMGLEQGIFNRDYWREFAKTPAKEFTPELWEEHVTREELIEFMMHAYKRFYTRPSYLLRQLLHIRSVPELVRKGKAGMKLLLK